MKKYEVAIYKEETYWEAILICLCGQSPEQRAILAPDFNSLLEEINKALAGHERRES